MATIEKEFAALWARHVSQHRGLKRSKSVQRELEKTVRKLYLKPFLKSGGGLFLRRDQHDGLRAAVLILKEDSGPSSRKAKHKFVVATAPADRASLEWARTILSGQLPIGESPCKGRLERGQISLLPWLHRQGIGVRAVQLEGEIEGSLRRLRRHYGKTLRVPFEKAGITILAAEKVTEIDPYIQLLQELYGRNPQFGTHVTDPKFMKGFREVLVQGINRGKRPLWLIRRNGKLLGGVDIFEPPRGPSGKRRAGFGVNLVPSLQGKGLARAIYETILMELHQRGVREYFGYTAQPGVMRLGKIMGRRLVALEVDRGIAKAFPRRHFKDWV